MVTAPPTSSVEVTAPATVRAGPGPNGPRPSGWNGSCWLYTLNEDPSAPREDREWCGKWLLFVPESHVDQVWELVRAETEAGRLGCRSKVSTALHYPAQVVLDPTKRVVAAFTYDCRDTADVRRVRGRLRELGFTEPIAYKTNAATRAGLYGEPADLRVHLFYE